MADNKKIYSIQINGIDQSIKQVDALSDSLQFLDKKIKELESRSVSVTSKSSGSNVKDLQTEDQLLKQIQSTEQQIANARREEYQQLLADKDLLKETKDLQEQRAAAERMAANSYANTMSGLKSELKDIKQVMQTTELGSDEFGKLTKRAGELTEKLKQLEQSYGQFGRNVGNYKSAAEGFKGLRIEVAGATHEFDNAKQALKTLQGELRTLQVKKDQGLLLSEEEVQRFKELPSVVAQLKSSIADAGKPMDALMDTMQSFVAIAQVTKGVSALFGLDNDKVEQSIQKLVALQNAMQGIQTIQKQLQSSEFLGGMFTKANAAIDKFSASLLGVSKNAKVAKTATMETAAANTAVATTAGAATVAVKALSFALKTVGIGIILTAVAFLVEGLQSLIEWFTKADEAAEKAKKVNEECAKAYAEAKSTITQYTEKVKNFNGTKQQEKKLVDELNSKLGKELGTYKSLAEWQKVLIERGDAYCESMLNQARAQAALNAVTEAYINLQQVQANIASGEYHHWYQTVAGDREADAKELEKANQRIENAENEYRRIVKETEQFDKTHSLGNYSPQIETAKKTGGKMTKTIKDIEADIAKARIDAMKQGLTKTLAQLELERNKRIAEAKKTGKLVQEQIEVINKTYQDKIFDARVQYHINLIKEEKAYAEKIKKVQEDIFNTEVEISKKRNELSLNNNIEGLTRPQKDNVGLGDKVFEDNIRTITYDYNFELPPKVLRQYRELDDELKNINIVMELLDTTTEEGQKQWEEYGAKAYDIMGKLKELTEKYPYIAIAAEKIIGSSLDDSIQNRTYAIETYYKTVLRYTQNAADKELEIEKEKLDTELRMLETAEQERHRLATSRYYDSSGLSQDDQSRYKMPRTAYKTYMEESNKGSLDNKTTDQIGVYFSEYRKLMDEWLNNLKKGVQEGKYTWEEYNEFMNQEAIQGYLKAKTEYENFLEQYNNMSAKGQAENATNLKTWEQNVNNQFVDYLDKVRQEQETHDNKMKVMQNKHNVDTEQAEKDHLEKMRQATVDYHSQMISEYERAMSAINSKIDKAERTNALGIINYSATKKALDDLEESVRTCLQKIQTDKMTLVTKLKEGEISFGDFSTLMDQLNTLEVQTQETAQNVTKKSKELFTNFMGSISQLASQFGSALNSLVSALGDYTDQQYENQIKELEDFIDKYEEKLQEQQEITQEHASEVDSIEQQLANARGARRQALIDKLNAEMAAQRASLAEEKRLEKEKKKLEDKKEKEEKERLKAQKKVQTVQAIINGAVAVTNALATQPVWLGIALAAVMAAASAVQIATINSQKYAQGGVIQGKSHAQGGVKVLGGQAEVEGGEYITNKVTTEKNVQLLEYINGKKRKLDLDDMIEFYSSGKGVKKTLSSTKTKFADGGVIPQMRNDINLSDRMLNAFEDYSNRPVQVAVVDIIDKTQQVNDVKVMAGLEV